MPSRREPNSEPTLSVAWTLALLEAFEQLGLDPKNLCERAQINDALLHDPDNRISRDASGRLWRGALHDASDPLLGLHAGEHVRFRINHLVPLLLLSAETFGEGVQLAIRYQELLSHGRVVSLQEDAEHRRIRLHKVESKLPVTEHEVEFLATALLNLFCLATSPDFEFAEVRFAHPQLGPIEEYERVFGCPVVFAQPHTELVVPDEAWNMPLPHHSTSLQAQFELMAAGLHETVHSDTVADASASVSALLPGGQASVANVAAAMHMTQRTLQRRLREAGTSFRAIVDMTRRRIVIDCVERRCDSKELLRLAGFSDARSLRRSLRRWGLELSGQPKKDQKGQNLGAGAGI